MFGFAFVIFHISAICFVVAINILSIIFCRLLNLIYRKAFVNNSIELVNKFMPNLIFALELHLVTLFTFYYFSISTGGVFLAISIFIATYYFAAWGVEYCQSQYLATHYVKLTSSFFSTSDLCKSKGNIFLNYFFVIVEIALIVFLFTPLSKFLLEAYFLGPCGKADLECLICLQHHENIWFAGALEFLGAFLIGAVVNEFEGMPLVVLAILYRLLLYPTLSTLGHELIFIHVLPVTAISYFAFCWDHFQYSYLVAHWLLPFLGSFAGWLFFHQQSHSSGDYVKTSVTSLAKVQSKDTPCLTPKCDKIIPQIKPFKSKCTKSTITEPICPCINPTLQPISKAVTQPVEPLFYNLPTWQQYPEEYYCIFNQPEYPSCSCCCCCCCCSCSPTTSYACNFEDSFVGSCCKCSCDCGHCGPICNFHNNTQLDGTSRTESIESKGQLENRQNPFFFTRLKVKLREAIGSIHDRLSVLYQSLTGRKSEQSQDSKSMTNDYLSSNSFSSGCREFVVLPASPENYSKARKRLKSALGRQNRVHCKYSN